MSLCTIEPSVTSPTSFRKRTPNFSVTHSNIHVFEHVVSQKPEKVAVISRKGIMTYFDLNHQADCLSARLTALNVVPGSVVGVAFSRGLEYVVAMLATWKSGCVYLPLDHSLPGNRMRFMMKDSGLSCLITTSSIAAQKGFDLEAQATICLDDKGQFDRVCDLPARKSSVFADSYDMAYIIYTSGTTGNPKGVSITHGNLATLVADIEYSEEISANDRILLFAPFCFDASIRDICGALMVGASLYVPQEDEILPGNLLKTIGTHKITNSVITPSVLRSCIQEPLPSLRTLVLAGEAADEALIRNWGAGRKLINAYGPTEATVCSTKQIYYNGQIPAGFSASVIGKPIMNAHISIVDDQNIIVSHGEVGEIVVSGPSVSKHGYINMPLLNADRFFINASNGHRSYKTGDLGRVLPGGEIECLGRIGSTRQVKLNGQRIELEEIESVLRSDYAVTDAAVIVRGEQKAKKLSAYVVPRCRNGPDCKEALSTHLDQLMRARLPSYSIPTSICFLDALPLSVNKKLDVKALPDPNVTANLDNNGKDNGLTLMEQKVAQALLEALDLPLEQILQQDTTYAELGGSSLQASLVLKHLNKSLGSKIQLGQFYRRNISLRQLTKLVTGGMGQTANMISQDLSNRVELPYDIAYNIGSSLLERHQHVLLTGATGFLGSHLLAELLKDDATRVSCIVRAKNDDAALTRTRSALKTWGLWDETFLDRIQAKAGDVSKPLMGLSADTYMDLARQTDTVFHSAAAVSFIASYEELEEANVTGTVEILRFTSTLTQKRLTYISTLSVFFGAGTDLTQGREVPVQNLSKKILTGYGQTKWVSEQLVLEFARLGGHALILRPGRLLGNTKNFKCPKDDFTVRLLASMIETGSAPTLDEIGGKDWQIDLTPVDLCARLICELSRQSVTGIKHIINLDTISYEAMTDSVGVPIERVPYQDWIQTAVKSKHLGPLSSLFTERISDKDEKSVFEALLQMTVFRRSAYEASAMTLNEAIGETPATGDLLSKYLAANQDIFN
ncbi:putative NRPS-like protein biosynthetic cluster [Bacidia gigantensis]|uniref:putative NRPS-like protein biosynthetic cluster n=1 Tax=Bacidia gigantensis TaxID=2732470 RepID=UPI001D04B9CC|nr:putative NRPS-like protein biosynthetic cluster [Bacidia gigantensis]KAG8527219.1 putative NRPS-like protein biosynthetic cluster [Bacidia gigantensis]